MCRLGYKYKTVQLHWVKKRCYKSMSSYKGGNSNFIGNLSSEETTCLVHEIRSVSTLVGRPLFSPRAETVTSLEASLSQGPASIRDSLNGTSGEVQGKGGGRNDGEPPRYGSSKSPQSA